MAHKSRPKPERIPFMGELGPRIGRGQDNVVYQHLAADDSEKMQPSGQVVKINHNTVAEHRVRAYDDREAAMRGLQYKKNKYEILKLFLGNFVPNSSFVLGEVVEGNNTRYAEYTVQEEVPRIKLNDLTEAQRKDPRLADGVKDLMTRLQYMYKVLGEVNARTAQGVSLDGKLDLGGVSDYVLAEDLDQGFDHIFTLDDANRIIDTNHSKNLLVDPETMQLSCIDFDQGQWRPGMDEAKEAVFSRVERDNQLSYHLGEVALGEAPGASSFTQVA